MEVDFKEAPSSEEREAFFEELRNNIVHCNSYGFKKALFSKQERYMMAEWL